MTDVNALKQRKLEIQNRRKRERKEDTKRLESMRKKIIEKRETKFWDKSDILRLFRDKKGLYSITQEIHFSSIYRIGHFESFSHLQTLLNDLVDSNSLMRKNFPSKSRTKKNYLTVYYPHEKLCGSNAFEPYKTAKAMQTMRRTYIRRLGRRLEKNLQFRIIENGYSARTNFSPNPNHANYKFDVYAENVCGETLIFECKNWNSLVNSKEVRLFLDKLNFHNVDTHKTKCYFVASYVNNSTRKMLLDSNIRLIELKKQVMHFRDRLVYKSIFENLNLRYSISYANSHDISFLAHFNSLVRNLEQIEHASKMKKELLEKPS